VLVEIYSDVVCPWCYIGKRRFEEALSEFEHADEVDVVWRPFQLDPRAPTTPSPLLDAYARKFGGPGRAMEIIDHVTEVAATVGLEFRLDIAQRGNTFAAHRLLWHVRDDRALQSALKERLMRAYFMEGGDIGDAATLAMLAGEVGVSDAESFLASDDGADEVRAGLAVAADLEITAVPTFVFDGGRWSVPGAQDPSVFLIVLRKVYERAAASAS
jgi:predicted DsbA family dithiol-disulfide isomerase